MAAAVRAPHRLSEETGAVEPPSFFKQAFPDFSYLVEKASPAGTRTSPSGDGLYKSNIAIGGHRGMGMNRRAPGLDLCTGTFRENTVESLCAAATSGAAFVEFDVQVTKDLVPVIWHDDCAIVRTADGCSRKLIRELDLAEFKQLRRQQIVRQCRGEAQPLDWECTVETELATLSEVFRGVPENIGFDIEVKMTTPHSAQRTPPAEVERVTAAVLAEVRNWSSTSRRRMVLSSFDPDVVLTLKQQQSSLPVLFLSDGMLHFADPRRRGHSTAVAFAAAHGLDGVVLQISELIGAPKPALDAAAAGLLVMTYGVGNNEAATVHVQRRWGVHAAIVDDVRGIVGDLRRGYVADVKRR